MEAEEEGIGSFGTELEVVVSLDVDAESQTRLLRTGSVCS